MVTAPAPAAARGANSRSNRGPLCPPRSAKLSVRTSAAATGVANIAPMVPASASATAPGTGTPNRGRQRNHAASATLRAMIGFSGPRLTPPARPRTRASARPGRARSGSGAATSSDVAGSMPACPGAHRTVAPTSSPVTVSTRTVHHVRVLATPQASGSRSHTRCWIHVASSESARSVRALTTPTTRAGTTERRRRPDVVPVAGASDTREENHGGGRTASGAAAPPPRRCAGPRRSPRATREAGIRSTRHGVRRRAPAERTIRNEV